VEDSRRVDLILRHGWSRLRPGARAAARRPEPSRRSPPAG